MTEATPNTINDMLTVFMPLFSSGFVLYLIKRWFDSTHAKVDKLADTTQKAISEVHRRIDKYEVDQRQCQVDLHKHFASKVEVGRLDDKTDRNTERIVGLETTVSMFQGGKL